MDTDTDPQVDRETLVARQVMADARFTVTDVSLVILTTLAVLYTLYFAAGIILPMVLALVLALLLSPVTEVLHKRLRLPRMLGAVLVIIALFSAIGAVGYAISVPASGWIAKAPQSLPTLQQKLGFLRQPIDMFEGGMRQMQALLREEQTRQPEGPVQKPASGAAPEQGAGQGPQRDPQQGSVHAGQAGQAGGQTVTVSQSSGMGMSVLAGTRAFLGQTLTLVVMLFFLLAEGGTLLRRFVEILPGLQEKKRAVQIATEVEKNISAYLVTITMMNLLVGVANGLSIWAFGLPDPLLWGTAAFLLNYIPILGPLTGMVIFFFVGLFTFPHPLFALAPAGVYLLIHIAEGETITPMLLAKRFTLNPLLVIAALMFWDWLWGIPGALLAVPLLAVLKILCDHIEALTPLGHLLGAEAPRRRSATRTAEGAEA